VDSRPSNQDLFHIILLGQGEVGVVAGGPELVAGHHEEHEGRHFFEHLVQPRVLERNSNPEEIDDNPGEIDVADDHNVEVAKQLQLGEGHRGLPISVAGLLQMPDAPNHWKENGPATYQVNQNEELLPLVAPGGPLLTLLHDDVRNVRKHLSWEDNHEDPLLLGGQDVLNEGPPRANQHDCEEQ